MVEERDQREHAQWRGWGEKKGGAVQRESNAKNTTNVLQNNDNNANRRREEMRARRTQKKKTKRAVPNDVLQLVERMSLSFPQECPRRRRHKP